MFIEVWDDGSRDLGEPVHTGFEDWLYGHLTRHRRTLRRATSHPPFTYNVQEGRTAQLDIRLKRTVNEDGKEYRLKVENGELKLVRVG